MTHCRAMRLSKSQAAALMAASGMPLGATKTAQDGRALPLPCVEASEDKKRRLRLKKPRASEAATQNAIGRYLDLLIARKRLLYWERRNGGGATVIGKGGKTRWMPFYTIHGFGAPRSKGVSDICGLLAPERPELPGKTLAIEVKAAGEKATEEQREYLARVTAGGGVAIVAYRVEDVSRVLPLDIDRVGMQP